jgi:hypothetical protein
LNEREQGNPDTKLRPGCRVKIGPPAADLGSPDRRVGPSTLRFRHPITKLPDKRRRNLAVSIIGRFSVSLELRTRLCAMRHETTWTVT